MKGPLIGLGVLVAVLIIAAAFKGDGAVGEGFGVAGKTFLKFLPILAIAFVVMGFVDVLIPKEQVQKWLGDESGFKGMAVAWLAGALTPAGSVMGMPIAAGLLKAGAGPAVLVTYLTSLATLSIIRIPLEIGFYGWRLMVLRVLASIALPFVAGFLARWLAPVVMRGG